MKLYAGQTVTAFLDSEDYNAPDGIVGPYREKEGSFLFRTGNMVAYKDKASPANAFFQWPFFSGEPLSVY